MFDDLRYGTYFVKETKAPNGYMLSDKVVKVEINDKGVFADDIELEQKDDVYSFEYENTKIETPKTGDSRNIIFAIGTMIISLLGIVILAIKKFKNRKNK